LKYAGELKEKSPFSGLLSIANPFDLTATHNEVHGNPFKRRFYSSRLAANFIRVLKRHLPVFAKSPLYDLDKILKSKTLAEFDELFTRRVFNFESLGSSYHNASCYHVLKDITCPTLCLNAKDDPIVPDRIIPYSELMANPNILLAVTERGGHIGWYENWLRPRRWFSDSVSEFAGIILQVFVALNPTTHTNRRNYHCQSSLILCKPSASWKQK